MDDVNERALGAFGTWLETLAIDATAMSDALGEGQLSHQAALCVAGGLNYLVKSLDLIDDGIEGLGFLDDAFMLRIACDHARMKGALPEPLLALAQGADLVSEFLGELSPRMDRFFQGLTEAEVRGRTANAAVSDADVRDDLLSDIRSWASHYNSPHFVLDERGLVKLRAFLRAKLPS